MIIKAAYESNIGNNRKKNEDNFFFLGKIKDVKSITKSGKTGFIRITSSKDAVFAVFDGMGGERHGEVASYTATSEMLFSYNKKKITNKGNEEFLADFFNSANTAVCEKNDELSNGVMGTTSAVLYLAGNTAWVGNIGDSRIYLLRDKTLKQISVDHCRKTSDGSKSSTLLQYLGVKEDDFIIEPFIDSFKVRRNDVFLLCSDGLTDMLSDNEICEIMKKNKKPLSCVSKLINSALNKGGKDNTTVLVCKIII